MVSPSPRQLYTAGIVFSLGLQFRRWNGVSARRWPPEFEVSSRMFLVWYCSVYPKLESLAKCRYCVRGVHDDYDDKYTRLAFACYVHNAVEAVGDGLYLKR